MKLWQALRGRPAGDSYRYTLSDLAKMYSDGGWYSSYSPWLGSESIDHSYLDYVQNAYKECGPFFSVQVARMRIFTQAIIKWEDEATPGRLFGTPDLRILERPWPNGDTRELLARMLQDADMAGNAYVAREGNRLRRLRPDWVEIVLTAPPAEAVESDIAGYLYRPGGTAGTAPSKVYLPEQVAHWAPVPDPDTQYRGMSWMSPVVREIRADKAASAHKLAFFQNAATPNLAVSFKDTVTTEQFKEFMEEMDTQHRGVTNAYKTLYTAGGADVTVIGADFKQLDFKAVQGAGETRIANAGGVPAVIVGLSEGLQGSSLNAGNYGSARRNFADGTLQDLWQGACGALLTVVNPPSQSTRLAVDKTRIPFLREDAKDVAEIQQLNAVTLRALTDSGYDPDAAVRYLLGDDLNQLLGQHSGLFSVQLQPPGVNGQAEQEGTDGNPA